MKSSVALVRFAQIFGVVLLAGVPSRHGSGADPGTPETVELWKTNWVKKVVTNIVEIQVPANRFVDEYHTNWTDRLLTNTVDVYRTNWTFRTLTNIQTVELFRTNRVTSLQTNWTPRTLTNIETVELFRTNLVTSVQTNWKTLTLTNRETVVLLKTNWGKEFVTNVVEVDMATNQIVNQYKTNWIEKLVTNRVTVSQTSVKTLTLTNWQTVIVMRTNWVKELLTNVVEMSLPATSPVAGKEPVKPAETRTPPVATPTSPPAQAPPSKDAFVIETVRTARLPSNGRMEVQLKARLASDPAATVQVQDWRVQRDDGSVVFFVKEGEFKEVLPLGKYKVELKARQDAAIPFSVVRDTLTVTTEGVTLQGATTSPPKDK